MNIPDELLSGITYKKFNKIVRVQVSEANPKISGLHVTALVGAKWREFKELYGMDADTPDLERVKNENVYSPSSETDNKDSFVCRFSLSVPFPPFFICSPRLYYLVTCK